MRAGSPLVAGLLALCFQDRARIVGQVRRSCAIIFRRMVVRPIHNRTAVLPVRSAQGFYVANKSGSTTADAIGDPVCRQSQPSCAMPSRLFEIKVEAK
jgi:hypothetical protein